MRKFAGDFVNRSLLVSVIFLLSVVNPACADWQAHFDALISKGFEDIALSDVSRMVTDDSLIRAINAETPSWEALVREIQGRRFHQPQKRGELQLFSMKGIDGVDRPWVLFVPENYQSDRPSPMIVELHGGVSQKNVSDDPVGWAASSEWLKLARQKGWLALFPYGQAGATWWDDVGMTNIRRQVHLAKHHYNIDDDRVYLVGFSDGASAGFMQAMIRPDDYAAIVALNGHMGVGSLDGNLPTYASNMAMTPVYAVTTNNDELYPTSAMAGTIETAMMAGANIHYRQLGGTHEFDYADKEMPFIAEFLERNPRNTMPCRIFWEAGRAEFGRCRWIEMSKVLPVPAADWHQDFNRIMISDRITIGFIPDEKSDGLKVENVLEKTYAAKVGLKPGDTIVKAAGVEVASLADFNGAKSRVNWGDRFDMTVVREGQHIELKGKLPEQELYYMFKRSVPSAAIKGFQLGNLISLEGSRVGGFRILVFPGQVNLDQKIEVRFNGKVVFNDLVKPDVSVIVRNYCEQRDRKMIPLAEIVVDL